MDSLFTQPSPYYYKRIDGSIIEERYEKDLFPEEAEVLGTEKKKNLEEAKSFFTRVGNDLTADFARLTSKITELEYKERLQVFRDFFRLQDEGAFEFDLKKAMARGIHFKDSILFNKKIYFVTAL